MEHQHQAASKRFHGSYGRQSSKQSRQKSGEQSDGARDRMSSDTLEAMKDTLDEMKTIVIAQTPGALKFLGAIYI